MEFVEDYRADAGQVRVGLQHPGQDAFGDNLDPGGFRGLGFAANAIANGLPDRFAKAVRHALCRGAGGKAAGFEHDDAPLGQPGVEHGQRHAGCLARTGRRLQHGAALCAQGVDQVGQGRVDGQGGL